MEIIRDPAAYLHPADVTPRDLGPWYTRDEAAEYLRVRPRTVDRMVREGKLTRYRFSHGDRPRFRVADVRAMIVPDEGGGAITRQHRDIAERMNAKKVDQ